MSRTYRHDAQFIVCLGHDAPQRRGRRTRTPLYQVGEKTGEAAEFVAEQLDDTGR